MTCKHSSGLKNFLLPWAVNILSTWKPPKHLFLLPLQDHVRQVSLLLIKGALCPTNLFKINKCVHETWMAGEAQWNLSYFWNPPASRNGSLERFAIFVGIPWLSGVMFDFKVCVHSAHGSRKIRKCAWFPSFRQVFSFSYSVFQCLPKALKSSPTPPGVQRKNMFALYFGDNTDPYQKKFCLWFFFLILIFELW